MSSKNLRLVQPACASAVEDDIFFIPRSVQALLVARENFSASHPPLRNRNLTGEIAKLLGNQQIKESISQVLMVIP